MLALETLLAAVGGILLGLGLGLSLGPRSSGGVSTGTQAGDGHARAGTAPPPARSTRPPEAELHRAADVTADTTAPRGPRPEATLALSDTVPAEVSRERAASTRTVSQRPPARRDG